MTLNRIRQPQRDGEIRQSSIRRPSPKRRFLDALQAKNAIKEIGTLPEPDETLHMITRGNVPLWQIVPATLTLASPASIESLYLATLAHNNATTTELLALLDSGQIRNVTLIVSQVFRQNSAEQFKPMDDGLKARNQRVVALRNHSKIVAMSMTDGRKFVTESSGNLRSCRSIEQISLTQSSELYDFHVRWMDSVVQAAAA